MEINCRKGALIHCLFGQLLLCIFLLSSFQQSAEGQTSFFQIPSPWVWKCENEFCERAPASTTPRNLAMSHAACKLTCYNSSQGYSLIWPKPTTSPVLSDQLIRFSADHVSFTKIAFAGDEARGLFDEASSIFLNLVRGMEMKNLNESTKTCSVNDQACGARPYAASLHRVNIEVAVTGKDFQIMTTTNESYQLSVISINSTTTIYIAAPTYFGARHALETLTQLMAWDDSVNSLIMISDATIEDHPVFAHRGVMIDTSRSFVEIPLLKRIIDGLSYNKMNVLHWHIADSYSFPFVSAREPLMAIYGAYSPKQVYRPQEVQELVHYGQVRGVKIIPELDGPAHAGAGWDWGPSYGMGDLVLCFGVEPWDQYCYQPPCGILNPANPKTFQVMNNIFKDMSELFQTDIFHIGGDEINFRCWNESSEIRKFMSDKGWPNSTTGFLQLWSYFHNKSLTELDAAYGNNLQKAVLWSSDLTADGNASVYIDKDRFIVQVWDEWNSKSTKKLLEDGYSLILSNYDALYLDCGFSSWVGGGLSNWCSPYKGWQLIYENGPRKTLENFTMSYADHKKQFIGGEAALWTEQAQGLVIESRIWPRACALAERLWSDPTTGWLDAEPRMRTQRNRMVERGIAADSIQPQYCDEHPSCFYPPRMP